MSDAIREVFDQESNRLPATARARSYGDNGKQLGVLPPGMRITRTFPYGDGSRRDRLRGRTENALDSMSTQQLLDVILSRIRPKVARLLKQDRAMQRLKRTRRRELSI